MPDTDDRWLEDLLSHDGQGGHIADGGFTDRLMARLPARRPRRHDGVIGLAAVIAATVGGLVLHDSSLVLSLLAGAPSAGQIVTAALVGGLALWGALAVAEA